MFGRGMVAAGVLGVVVVHQLPTLPTTPVLWVGTAGVLLVALLAWRGRRLGRGVLRWLASALAAGWVGFCLTAFWAHHRLEQVLVAQNVDRVTRVELRIENLPRLLPDRASFEALVLWAHPPGVPERIRVTWPAGGWRGPYAAPVPADPPFPELHAGQVWRMALLLRPIQAARNLHAFDYERHSFVSGIRAQGTVRGRPELVRTDRWVSLSVVAERARHEVRKAMDPYLQGLRYGSVLRALAIGDQDGVDDADWMVFNRSGLTHLVSISGSHITMLSGFAALAAAALWRRLRWRGRLLAERWPARRAAACVALLVAWLYCLLAGWGVPAQRTFMMLAVVAGAQALQLRLSGSRVLAAAAVAVLALDPWAVLTSGFWLSFLAVCVLLAVGASERSPGPITERSSAGVPDVPAADSVRVRWWRAIRLAARLQWAVTWALAPALAWLFYEISLVSPIANAYSIPLIELVVTPLSLLLAATALVPGLQTLASGLAWLAHGVLYLMMQPTEWLARLPTIPIAAGPVWLYLLACAGAVVALWPGLPTRCRPLPWGWRLPHPAWGWLAFLPMVFWAPSTPAEGEWELHALDVGQGSALLLRTASHALLFDAGARHSRDSDEGSRTIVPALRAQGIRRLDALIVSHADVDHAGGVRSVLAGVPVEQTFSSFDLASWLRREARLVGEPQIPAALAASPCQFGTHWSIDGVSFEFLWPMDVRHTRRSKETNDGSCVLRVRGAYHSLLLTGDIERRAEAALVLRGLSPADVVVAAHHGSRTSSSAEFVQAVTPGHVILQVGRWNRHSHPDADVLSRWADAGARVWRTDWQGGIVARSRGEGLTMYSILESSRRYWHGRRP
ncbi:MAG: DNA internalization-related competence protein ComEC/Rec2 [Castellaniella sp.]|uniref:DNA internalization-related competence protein ComEC/Rec2 n=1 Tax=Castellaniella sp. TaxID=1955812 RepID=UPI001203155D|nr:DNA internalization-related competence protein ComEC/Rec2 [Castellaniella sp.]TAN27833.1 MAG: DNA internalization-related competence protein ComEC/Rec2 [Castellaniella sp.]